MFEPVAKFVVNFADDFVAGFFEVFVAGGGLVDEDEGGFFVDAKSVEELAFEAGLFDEPARVDFVATLPR